MPWQEVSIMALRREFVMLAAGDGIAVRELSRRFGISPPTAYKWLGRYATEGVEGLANRSRRPQRSPNRTATEMEEMVLAVRDAHPAWGGRKIRRWLLDRGRDTVPSASTITAILRRHDRLDPDVSASHHPWQRFEHPEPNQLWQMDFKGHFPLGHGRCHPLTVLDDHSRFALGLHACGDERGETVQQHLTTLFRHNGLPDRILMDNGPPWGHDADHPYTPLTVWLLRLGVDVTHGRPYHPQTQGKDERFHQTLKAEVLQGRRFSDLPDAQRAFDAWRPLYNFERPHEALGMATPGSRYRPSPRFFPETLPPIEYGPSDHVRMVQAGGEISWHNRALKVGNAFRGYPVALRPTLTDGVWDVFFCTHQIITLDLRDYNEP
jgi:transposase InsO family protein